MRRSRLYFLGAVIEVARYFVFVRLASGLAGMDPGSARVLLHLVAPHLVVAGGLAALSHDPVRYDPLRPLLAVAKALSVATALALLPTLATGGSPSSSGLSPFALMAGFGGIAAWDLALAGLLAAAGRPAETRAPSKAPDIEAVPLDAGGGDE